MRLRMPSDRTIRIVFSSVFLGVVAADAVAGLWLNVISTGTFGLAFLMWQVQQRSWTARGYLRARTQIWLSMIEAQRRGLTMAEWLLAEMARDRGNGLVFTTQASEESEG